MIIQHALASPVRGPFTKIKVLETDLEIAWYQGERVRPLNPETKDSRLEFNIEFHNHEALNWGLVRILQPDPRVDPQRIPIGGHLDLIAGFRGQPEHEHLKLKYWVIERVNFTRTSHEIIGVEVHIYDGAEEWLRTVVSRSYLPGVKASEVFYDIYRSFLEPRGITLRSYQPGRDLTYRRGRAFPAIPVRFAMESVARDMGSRAFIWNRGLFLHAPDASVNTPLVLENRTGLLLAEPILASNEPRPALQDPRPAHYHLCSFLNPNLFPDGSFELRHLYFQEKLRVLSGRHYSDGDRWWTDVEATKRRNNA